MMFTVNNEKVKLKINKERQYVFVKTCNSKMEVGINWVKQQDHRSCTLDTYYCQSEEGKIRSTEK